MRPQDGEAWQAVANAPPRVRQLVQGICQRAQVHTHTPVAIASGFAGLVQTCQLVLLCSGSPRQAARLLCRFVDSFVSYTTDMGVEAGFADFQCQSMRSLLAPWMEYSIGLDVADAAHAQGEGIETDAAGESVDLPHASPAEGADEPSGFVFRNAFAAPGLLHIAHNLRATMHTVYPGEESCDMICLALLACDRPCVCSLVREGRRVLLSWRGGLGDMVDFGTPSEEEGRGCPCARLPSRRGGLPRAVRLPSR